LKIISIKVHGILDYFTVLAFALIPCIFGLTGVPAYLSYTLSGVHFLMSVLTRFPLGLVKIIPVKLHRIVETIVGPALIISPWGLGFAEELTARYVFIGAGVIISIVGLLTHYSDS
jgi:hypothetical protein